MKCILSGKDIAPGEPIIETERHGIAGTGGTVTVSALKEAFDGAKRINELEKRLERAGG